MDKTTLHTTEYRGDQLIDFFGITSFKVQNHGEAVVEINTIPIYPGQTLKIIEEDSTQCDFTLQAKFTEEGKIPKFRAIYKQFGNADCYPHLHPALEYAVTLYGYEQGDIVDFSQNISGHTFLTRSFDGGVTFPPENDIDLGFVEANQVVKYDLGGSLDTNAIQFRNDDSELDSEIFMVGDVVAVVPFDAEITAYSYWTEPSPAPDIIKIIPNKSGLIYLQYSSDGIFGYPQVLLGNLIAGQEYTFNDILPYHSIWAMFKFFNETTQQLSPRHDIVFPNIM
jgi:hypothetical protein